eukprot:CAMPEP_0170740852 /NCGR_PEP_ID=MMETSP0437-20130122/5904_1 /TAXON_ID=0 /ORGANISM="Sexangularia sp." /LENGTH=296 /DNA_ID=CAMNT_0011079379 /DNA_START=57 /DNA_END=947 /DNA_ORIENTATION=+
MMPTDEEIASVARAQQSMPSSSADQQRVLHLLATHPCLGTPALRLALVRSLRPSSYTVDSAANSILVEQTFVAELECGSASEAQRALTAMEAAFPAKVSPKTSLYQAQYAAGTGDVAKADELLVDAIARFPTSSKLAAARVSLHRDAGHLDTALQLAGDYTTHYPSDADGWLEAAELYATAGSLDRALFCIDQTLLLRPTSVGVWTRKGELCYTAGGPANVRAAATAFARAVELTNDSRLDMRAMWSLYVALRRGGGPAGGPTRALALEVGKRITAAYADKCPSLLAAAEDVISTI